MESYLSNIEINDEKLDINPVNDGYYYSRQTTSSGVFKDTYDLFMIKGMFKGDDSVYSVAIQCRLSDKDDYEEPMLEWLESFKLR